METVGDLFDKICILERREKAHRDDKGPNTKVKLKELKQQKKVLLQYLSSTMEEVIMGSRPAEFKKNKIYDDDIGIEKNDSFINAIWALNLATCNLWDFEDTRRDKTLDPIARLAAADHISKWNKIRNDTIDQINEIFAIAVEE
jgi:hypothetical protein